MEGTKQKFTELSDYSVSETTLEQVFLSFAKKQRKNFKDQWQLTENKLLGDIVIENCILWT